ncbi:MAG TPA: glycosyltransferase [Candidatus Saccharimonadales bacterium]
MNTKPRLTISVIIPFKDKGEMTLDCVRSFLEYGPKVQEIILVSNNSSSDELKNVRHFAKQYPELIRVLEYNHPFNYQKMNNWAVKKSNGQTIMFLNNDTELRPASRGLIEKMYKKAQRKNVGITGCLLLYGDEKTIQHAGVFLMPEGMADHMYITKRYSAALDRSNKEEFPYDITIDRKMTAVTGAVNLITREKFEKIGMYDERFIIGGGDVDLCIRLNKAGYQTWFVAGGYILHKESQSRKKISISYNDFYWSYLSYITAYDPKVGDPFLPEITKKIRIYGA